MKNSMIAPLLVGSLLIVGVSASVTLNFNAIKAIEERDLQIEVLQSTVESVHSLKAHETNMKESLQVLLKSTTGAYDDLLEQYTALLESRDLLLYDAFVVTAYSPYDDQNGLNSDGNPDCTATGTKPRPGTMAVDPDVIPYGSTIVIVYEDGTVETGIAEDCGGAIKQNRIDTFRYTYNEAIQFGRRQATVYVYK